MGRMVEGRLTRAAGECQVCGVLVATLDGFIVDHQRADAEAHAKAIEDWVKEHPPIEVRQVYRAVGIKAYDFVTMTTGAEETIEKNSEVTAPGAMSNVTDEPLPKSVSEL
jgi:hypothetical protein